jgi:two-component system NtrC family sensor kinase
MMIHIAQERGLGLASVAAIAGTERWGTGVLVLGIALLGGLYLRERRLRQRELTRHRRRRESELGALNTLAGIFSRTFDLDEILASTAHCIRELFAQHCDILLFDAERGGVTRSQSTRQLPGPQLQELGCMVEQDLSAYILREHSEILTEQNLPLLPPAVQSWMSGRGHQSFVMVVLYSHRRLLGILFLSSPAKKQFSTSDCSFTVAIARQLGNSVEKVLFYEETENASQSLRDTQEQLLQSEKMSAVGQLIAGVAHELNNPLTAILGYAQLLETEPIGEQARDYVRKLYLQTRRTHRVVQNLLSFSRQRKPIQSQVDLRRVLDDSLALREFDLKLNGIQVEIDHDPSLPFIIGDAHQLEQVFLNIINNAVDSIMDIGAGGSLKIRFYSEDHGVCVEFHDTGTGLKDPSKIFDPFYTTKKIGKGSGLGLSICYGIVKEHGGDILAFNHAQGGAVLQLKLPVGGAKKVPE